MNRSRVVEHKDEQRRERTRRLLEKAINDSCKPSSVMKPSLLLVRQRSSEVESALLEANRGDEARYNKSVMEIAANLSRNSMLTKRLLEGRLSASTLVTMDVREMAPEHVQRARKERQEEAFRRRTHLGEKGEMRLKSLEGSPHRRDSGPSGHTPVSERKRRRVIEDDDEDDEDEEEAALPTSAQTTQDTVAAADDDEEEASTDSEDDRPIKQVYKEKNPGKGSPRTPNRERGSTPKKSPRKEKAGSPASEEEEEEALPFGFHSGAPLVIKTKRTSLGTFSCGPVKITITDDTIGLQLVEGWPLPGGHWETKNDYPLISVGFNNINAIERDKANGTVAIWVRGIGVAIRNRLQGMYESKAPRDRPESSIFIECDTNTRDDERLAGALLSQPSLRRLCEVVGKGMVSGRKKEKKKPSAAPPVYRSLASAKRPTFKKKREEMMGRPPSAQEVEIVGVRSRKERDEELKKNAIDVDPDVEEEEEVASGNEDEDYLVEDDDDEEEEDMNDEWRAAGDEGQEEEWRVAAAGQEENEEEEVEEVVSTHPIPGQQQPPPSYRRLAAEPPPQQAPPPPPPPPRPPPLPPVERTSSIASRGRVTVAEESSDDEDDVEDYEEDPTPAPPPPAPPPTRQVSEAAPLLQQPLEPVRSAASTAAPSPVNLPRQANGSSSSAAMPPPDASASALENYVATLPPEQLALLKEAVAKRGSDSGGSGSGSPYR